MAEMRMSLEQASKVLGIAPNSVRSRWKRGKIKGERDNSDKIWVWVDVPDNDNPPPSQGSIEKPSQGFEISALQDHLKTLKEQLSIAAAELAELRPKAAEADHLRAENAGLRGQLDIRAEQLAELRQLMATMKETHADELRRWIQAEPAKGFFARLFGR